MGTAVSVEPCVYERLWESIVVLRESGHRYGMSERDIERFITQVLQTNEPQPRDPPAFPLLRATAKWALAVGLLLVLVLGLSQPQSQSALQTLGYNWLSPLGPVRLLALPIAHKYNLQGFHGWWGGISSQQPVVNCSVCTNVGSVWEAPESLRGAPALRRRPQPVLIKGGASVRIKRQQLEQLFLSHSESVSLKLDEEPGPGTALPEGPANFTLLWRFSTGSREKLLRWLFPKAELCPLLDSSGTALQRCVVTHLQQTPTEAHSSVRDWLVLGEGLASVKVHPVQVCSQHCPSFKLHLRPGDMVFADSRFWQMDMFPGPDQTIFCDGSRS